MDEENELLLARIERLWSVHAQSKYQLAWLISLLAHEDRDVVNRAALALSALRAHAAVPHLVRLLPQPQWTNRNGSLVYALRRLDCRAHLLPVAEQLSAGSYEAREMALQVFECLPNRLAPRHTRPVVAFLRERLRSPGLSEEQTWYLSEALQVLRRRSADNKQSRRAKPNTSR
jgi:hypothetical protein